MVLELEDNSQNENLKQEQMNIIQQALLNNFRRNAARFLK